MNANNDPLGVRISLSVSGSRCGAKAFWLPPVLENQHQLRRQETRFCEAETENRSRRQEDGFSYVPPFYATIICLHYRSGQAKLSS